MCSFKEITVENSLYKNPADCFIFVINIVIDHMINLCLDYIFVTNFSSG